MVGMESTKEMGHPPPVIPYRLMSLRVNFAIRQGRINGTITSISLPHTLIDHSPRYPHGPDFGRTGWFLIGLK